MKYSLFAICLLTVIQSFAQDQKAKSILEQVTKSTQSYKTIQADFTYLAENEKSGFNDENKGNAILKGQKYRLSLPSLGLEMFCNGEIIWSYMEDANEVSITYSDDETTGIMNPALLFTIYEHGFSHKFVAEKNVDGVAVYIIDLLPDDKEFEYDKIQIQIDKNQMMIRTVAMHSRDGNKYTVKIDNIKTNIAVDEKVFTFDKSKYPKVEEIDLR